MKRTKITQKGFTLVEVIIAIMILTLGILAVSQMTVMGMHTSAVINRQMYAREVLSQFHERVSGLPANDTFYLKDKNVGNLLDDTNNADYKMTVTTHGGAYRVIWNVSDGMINDTAPDPRFKVVRVQVFWPNSKIWVKSDIIKKY